jgi:DNA polymerase-3 subunit gamma/tau
MSYLVLARKYRSSSFDDLVGQENVARTLKRAIESGRIAHAFLFCGTRGVGKTSMARILAKALNCDNADAPTAKPCGKCTSCKAITAGEDMDVIEIDAASHTQVEKIRELIENSRYRPARARFKVYIIDEVHMLSKGSFNALLKTLEEPPSHVKFILATTETEKVPATILSRCQRYDFRNIPTREIAEHLKAVCRKEGVKADEAALRLVAKSGAGSMRDALSLLDRLLSLGEKELSVDMIERLLGLPKAQLLFDLAQAMGTGDVKRLLESADKMIREGLSPEQLVVSLAEHLRNLLLLATCGKDSHLVEVPGVPIDELYEQARLFDTVALTQSIAVLEEVRRGLRSSSAGRAMLDAVLVRLALAEQFTPIAALLNRDDAPSPAQKKKLTPVPPAAEPPDATGSEARSVVVETFTSPPDTGDALPAVGRVFDGPKRSLGAIFAASRASDRAAPREVNVETVDQGEFAGVMSRLRSALREHGPGYDGLLVHGQIVALGDGQAVIRFGQQHEASAIMLERNGKRETVQRVLGELLNEPVGLKIEIDATPVAEAPHPAPREPARKPAPPDLPPPPPAAPPITPQEKQRIMESDPLVRAACELFDGEIVKAE